MTYRISCVMTATGQLLGCSEDTWATAKEAQAHADFYNEQVADEPYRYVVAQA
jgi:hypothetical protein